ncbi:transcriptional regulator, partial [Bacillus cereus]
MTSTVLESKKTNITEEDVEILKIMAHPIRLRIVN